jgi:hypothetical protein
VRLISIIFLLGIVGRLLAADPNGSLVFVDDYLGRWDRFAQGENSLVPYLRDNKKKFEGELASLLRAGDKNATGRVVFYAVVQVGGFIDVDSDLGREVAKAFGSLPLTEVKDGEKKVFAGDLYFWWQERKKDFLVYPLYEEWLKRDFTRNSVIQLYRNVRENEKKNS